MSLVHVTPATVAASRPFHTPGSPVSGSSPWLFPLPGMPFPRISTCRLPLRGAFLTNPLKPAKAVVPSPVTGSATLHCGSRLSPCLCVSGLSLPPTPCSLGMSTTGEQGHHGPVSGPCCSPLPKGKPTPEQELHKQLLSEYGTRMGSGARLHA